MPVRQDPPGSRCEVERLIREAITVHVESLRAHGESVEPPFGGRRHLVTVPAA